MVYKRDRLCRSVMEAGPESSRRKLPSRSMIAHREIALNRILVVDDHAAARRGLRSVLAADPTLEVVSEAADAEEALRKAEELRPGIMLLDITLPGESGIQVAVKLRAVFPECRVIFVSQHDSVQIAKEALSVGAYGYVVKSDAGYDLLAAIEAARVGRIFVSRTLVARGWHALSAGE
jgi:DNA-binding NarL/FixJ family response regulator